MTFENDKKTLLTKMDKSPKGSVDELIKPLCNLINGSGDYYTTSSCSGRIVLITSPPGGKADADWLLVSHSIVKFEDVTEVLKGLPKEEVWLRFDPLILHIACRDMGCARSLLELIRGAGFKRSGIISTNKYVIELIGSERLDAPIAADGKLLVGEEYISYLLNDANRKLVKNEDHIDRLFRKLLKINI